MPNVGVYFREEELEEIRKRGDGFIRAAVLEKLYEEDEQKKVLDKNTKV
jgi:hypothetical protein